MNALQLAQQVNRRLFLQSSGMSLGAMALGSLLDATASGREPMLAAATLPKPRRRRRLAGLAALSAQDQAGDLSVPVGRSVAARPVRPQARI